MLVLSWVPAIIIRISAVSACLIISVRKRGEILMVYFGYHVRFFWVGAFCWFSVGIVVVKQLIRQKVNFFNLKNKFDFESFQCVVECEIRLKIKLVDLCQYNLK